MEMRAVCMGHKSEAQRYMDTSSMRAHGEARASSSVSRSARYLYLLGHRPRGNLPNPTFKPHRVESEWPNQNDKGEVQDRYFFNTPFRYAVPRIPTAKRTTVSSQPAFPSFKRRLKLRFDDFQETKISFLGHIPSSQYKRENHPQ